ncbi:hypothetical protein STENM327S_07772 [Streptomyces tendae]
MLNALEVFTTVVVGLMVGVEFSVAFIMSRILDALPEDSRQLGHAHGGRMLGAVMPIWYMGSVALSAIWAVAGRHHHGAGLVVTAAGLLLLRAMWVMLTMLPPPPLRIDGATALMPRNCPVTFTLKVCSQVRSSVCSTGAAGFWTPALFTRMVIGPKWPSTSRTAAAQSSSLVTSR